MHAIVNDILMVHRGWSERDALFKKIDGSKYRNIWVVGDLHRMLHEPDEQTGYNWIDNKKTCLSRWAIWLIVVQRTLECLKIIAFPWFRAVRGNHEQMMIDGLSERGNVNHCAA